MVKQKIWESLMQCSFYAGISDMITEETSLIHTIQIDSIQLLEFIVNIERTIGFKIDFENLSIDDFDSINNLTEALKKYNSVD